MGVKEPAYPQNVVRVPVEEYNQEMLETREEEGGEAAKTTEHGVEVIDSNHNLFVDGDDIFVGSGDFDGSLDTKDRLSAMCRDWRPRWMPPNAHFSIVSKRAEKVIEKNGGVLGLHKPDETIPKGATFYLQGDARTGYVVHLLRAGLEFHLDTEFNEEFGGCNLYDFMIIDKGFWRNNIIITYQDANGPHKISYNTENGRMWWQNLTTGRWKRLKINEESKSIDKG